MTERGRCGAGQAMSRHARIRLRISERITPSVRKQKPQGIRDLHHLRANCARHLVALVRELSRHGLGSQVNA